MAKSKPYTLSALALSELDHVALTEGISAADLMKCTFESARAFPTTTYYVLSGWFKTQPRHDFEAFVIRRDGVPRVAQRMVIDVRDRQVLSHVEAPLDDYDYYARRVIEEVLLDSEIVESHTPNGQDQGQP